MAFGQFSATTALTQMIPQNFRRIGTLIKSTSANTDAVFLKMDSSTSPAGTTANLVPLYPGESIYLTANSGNLGSADWNAAVLVLGLSGGEDIRWIDF